MTTPLVLGKEVLVQGLERLLDEFEREKNSYIEHLRNIYRSRLNESKVKRILRAFVKALKDWKEYIIALGIEGVCLGISLITGKYIPYENVPGAATFLYLFGKRLSKELAKEFGENFIKELIEKDAENVLKYIGAKYYDEAKRRVLELYELDKEYKILDDNDKRIIRYVIKRILIPYAKINPDLYEDLNEFKEILKYINAKEDEEYKGAVYIPIIDTTVKSAAKCTL